MKDKEDRQFKGIWIDRDIWLDSRINALDKVILAEIDSLDVTEEGCYASNEYLSNFCQCSVSKVSSSISKLIECGYLSVKKFDGRTRYLKSRLIKKTNQPFKTCEADCQNLEEINIYNNINDNIYSPSDDEQDNSSLPKEQELAQNFNKIWKNYPRKDGKNKAYQHYKAWLKGRKFAGETKKFTDKEMYWAVKVYAYECDRDKVERKFIQMGSTFFNDTIESKVNRYNKYPEGWEQKINEWEKNKNENL